MEKAKLPNLWVIIFLLISLVGCHQEVGGPGELQVVVFNSEGEAVDDVYAGVYSEDFEERIDFIYTTRGRAIIENLEGGVYGFKLVSGDKIKQTKVSVTSGQTTQLEFELEDLEEEQ